MRVTEILLLCLVLFASLASAAKRMPSKCYDMKLDTRNVCDKHGADSEICEAHINKTIVLCCPKDEKATSLCANPHYFDYWLKTGRTIPVI